MLDHYTGKTPKQVIVDLGYRGVDKDNPDVEIIHRGKYKSLTKQQRRWLKRRQAVEPVIGHLKSDNRMDRCWLPGQLGDALHAVLCAAGYNLRWVAESDGPSGPEGAFIAPDISGVVGCVTARESVPASSPGGGAFAGGLRGALNEFCRADYTESGIKERAIHEFRYAADSWNIERRLVTRLEFGAQGPNPRFVVTNLDLPADALYDGLYCQRGEAENRIKETQLDLFGTRTSSRKFLANWLRCLFSALAYTLMQRLRVMTLAGTELARASAATIRVKLLKIGAAVIRNTRHIRILFASHHPLREAFLTAARALASP